jgi:ribosomal protein S18 acetylase RimI-like enzyme
MTPPAVRRADASDARTITQVLATGFRTDPPLMWILPDQTDRERLSPAFFAPFVDLVLAEGRGYVTADGSGAALWLDVDVTAPDTEDGGAFQQRFVDALGPEYAKRFFALDELFTARHPGHEPHAYLVFVGVVPDRQNQGVGTALLSTHLSELDAAGRPAYVEASTTRNAGLYARLGFAPLGEPITLPEGPALHPMWRPARPSSST